MTNKITREYFEKRQAELLEKWKLKAANNDKDEHIFYTENQDEFYKDLEELCSIATALNE